MDNHIKVGGVPEHFNMPWHWAIQNGFFERKGIDIQWIDFPGGTGAMNKALRNNEIDIALMLTEGAIADIANGNPSKILQWYVKSPLLWGIHVGSASQIDSTNQTGGKKYAISRIGSGSHLMAKVDSYQRKIGLAENQFVIVNNLNGAREALTNGDADIFMWEKFMTKPYVDQGVFRRIGECPTPWPCFVMVTRNAFFKDHQPQIQTVQSIINKVAGSFKNIPFCEELIADKYQLNEQDVITWLNSVEWADNSTIDHTGFMEICDMLLVYGIVSTQLSFEDMVVKY